jgi:hypothetical protein
VSRDYHITEGILREQGNNLLATETKPTTYCTSLEHFLKICAQGKHIEGVIGIVGEIRGNGDCVRLDEVTG